MALVRWAPMRNLASFQEEMNRLFNEFFLGGNGDEAGRGVRTWTPLADIYETDDELVLEVELPGVAKEDIDVELQKNILTLRGQRKREAGVQEERYHRAERTYGMFQRSFVLPTMVDQDKVQATYHDGLLELRLAKSETAKPKRIAIAS